MEVTRLQKRKGQLVIGAAGLLLSAGYLGMAVQLPFGQLARPGAGIFPVIVGAMLVLTSLATIWEGWRTGTDERVDFPTGPDRRRVLALVGSLLLYIVALPWLGQIVASTLFLIVIMRVLSDVGWPRVIAAALVIALLLYAVFVRLLQVPMPRGILES